MNPILNADGYKPSHFLQYPPEVKFISSYIESRGGRWSRVVFYGLQMFLKEYLTRRITQDDIDEAEAFFATYGEPFNRAGWEFIVREFGGALPLRVEAVAEGSVVETENALVQISNTHPNCAWLTSYVETALLRAVWYPCAVATQSFYCRQKIAAYLRETGDERNIDFALHDFGARGVSSFESAGIGGSAHLLNFRGTDTITGAIFASKYYGASAPAASIPAAEHSTITTWGREREDAAYANMVARFGDGVFACVIDSYDTLRAVEKFKPLLAEIARRGGRVSLRPDSGNPVQMAAACIEKLFDLVGYTSNEKYYRLLPPFVRVIYGDGIDEQTIGDILAELKFRRISADNICFGMGGALLQHLNRDTLKFAMKASAVSADGVRWTGVRKSPVTDASKSSKAGRLALVREGGRHRTIGADELGTRENLLAPVFENGEILREWGFDEIRQRLWGADGRGGQWREWGETAPNSNLNDCGGENGENGAKNRAASPATTTQTERK